jgi:putative hydrolase of the HAD superfamily
MSKGFNYYEVNEKMIVSKKFKVIFLDIGGVLLTNGWDHNMRQMAAKKFGLNYAEMNERHHLTFDTYEEGKLSLKEYLQRVVFYQPRPFSLDEFQDFMFGQSKAYPDMIDLISQLKSTYSLNIAAISNEGRELTEYRIQTFNLDSLIDFFISSCFVHFRKPDVDIYRIALDIAQVKAEHAIYIDDRPMFVDVASGLGIHSIIHSSVKETCQVLESMGLSLEI